MEMKKCNRVFGVKILFVCGATLLCLSVVIHIFGNPLFRYKLNQGLVLRKDSDTVKKWSTSNAIILRKFYFFDIKNPNQILKGAKPELIERGPYVYRENKRNINITFQGHNLLTFSQINTLYFEPSLSVGSENDMLTFLNIPAAAMIDKAIREHKQFTGKINFGYLALNGILDYLQVQLFLTKTVGQFITGYDDQLLEFGHSILPEVITSDKFSLLNGENNTVKENFTIMNGADDISNYGRVVAWNGLKKLNYWSTDKANTIDGFDSTCFSPFKERSDTLNIFTSGLGRSILLDYNEDIHVDGFDTFKFSMKKELFYNASINPENEGYGYEYPGNGVHNIGKLTSNSPTYLSLPHFLNAEQKFVDGVGGLAPDENKHDFTLHLEPITGVPIQGNGRLQINVLLQGNKNIFMAQNIKTVLLPVFWAEVTFEHDPNTLKILDKAVLIFRAIKRVSIVLFCVGLAVASLTLIYLLVNHFQEEQSKDDKIPKKNVKYSMVNVDTKNVEKN